MKSTLILVLLLKIFVLRTANSRRPVLTTNSESKDDSKIELTTPRLDSKLALNTIRNSQSIKIDLPPKTTEMKRRTFRVPELSSKATTENNTTEKTTSLQEIVTSKPQSALLQEISTTEFTSTQGQVDSLTNQTPESSETTTEHEAVEETTTLQERTTPELHALQIGLIAFIIIFITIAVGHCYYKRNKTEHAVLSYAAG